MAFVSPIPQPGGFRQHHLCKVLTADSLLASDSDGSPHHTIAGRRDASLHADGRIFYPNTMMGRVEIQQAPPDLVARLLSHPQGQSRKAEIQHVCLPACYIYSRVGELRKSPSHVGKRGTAYAGQFSGIGRTQHGSLETGTSTIQLRSSVQSIRAFQHSRSRISASISLQMIHGYHSQEFGRKGRTQFDRQSRVL